MASINAPSCTQHSVNWNNIAPREHLLHIYEDDSDLLTSLESFVCSGLQAGESVIVIATASHRDALALRMHARGIDVDKEMVAGHFLPRDAEETLNSFMLNGWPNSLLFETVVGKLFKQAQTERRKVRAYGEMVAILWEKGLTGATVWLEHLWNEYMQHHPFSLFCAYPKSGFAGEEPVCLDRICCQHTHLIEV